METIVDKARLVICYMFLCFVFCLLALTVHKTQEVLKRNDQLTRLTQQTCVHAHGLFNTKQCNFVHSFRKKYNEHHTVYDVGGDKTILRGIHTLCRLPVTTVKPHLHEQFFLDKLLVNLYCSCRWSTSFPLQFLHFPCCPSTRANFRLDNFSLSRKS